MPRDWSLAARRGLAHRLRDARPRAPAWAAVGRSRPSRRPALAPAAAEFAGDEFGHPPRIGKSLFAGAGVRVPGTDHDCAGIGAGQTFAADCTGAAQTRFCVKTPAAVAGRSEITTAMSRRSGSDRNPETMPAYR